MKKGFIVFLTLVGLFVFVFVKNTEDKNRVEQALQKPKINLSPTPIPTTIKNRMLFVPYWTLGETIEDSYDSYIYFGASVNEQGVMRNEEGMKNLSKFLRSVPEGKKKYLAVRMINSQINTNLLGKKEALQTIAAQAAEVASRNNFDGIVLDFEIAALSFDKVIEEISDLYKIFSAETKKSDLTFRAVIYGDVFARLRPYDVKKIAEHTDEIIVMAYDFHKANGEPGPNFPLMGKETYGYDFTRMVEDFSKNVERKKLTIVFGMFGYDWEVNTKGESVETAEPLSLYKAKKLYIDSCSFSACVAGRDSVSQETKVMYKDIQGKSHVVWFEDLESMKKKEEYLKSQGIESIGFWAHSFF